MAPLKLSRVCGPSSYPIRESDGAVLRSCGLLLKLGGWFHEIVFVLGEEPLK
jgi:hypothetical protein